MNTLQMIWSALTVPNEMLFKIITIPLTYLDAYIGMLFFSTILNIETSKKRRIAYVLIYGTLGNIMVFLVPTSYTIFVNILMWPLFIFFILKTTITKTLLAEIITLATTSVLDFIIAGIFLNVFKINYDMLMSIPLYRIISILSIYAIMFLLCKAIKYLKLNIKIIDSLNFKTKLLLSLNIFLVLFVIAIQFYLVRFYSDTMPFFITFAGILGLVAYAIVSIYNLINMSNLAITKRDLESAQHTVHTTKILHDQVRSFKHDFDNMVNIIGGYVVNEDMNGLKIYYKQLLEECNKTNNLYALSPEVINHPAVYHLLATKYYEADQQNVQINLHVFLDLNEIEKCMKIYEFTRILGILLDNAIEAAKECDKKIINVTFRKENNNNMIAVIIQNTYSNKDVDTEAIFQKGETTKENHSGLGLWKVREILMRNNNLNLYTTKNNEFFTQQFEIYT